ncbi:MAG: aconitate hydratase AcnA [Neisseria sp.]|nr:aconitate hydratase AcnA [Neisseria sp.]
MNTNYEKYSESPPPTAKLLFGDATLSFVDLPALLGKRLPDMPVVLRLLLENVVRNMQGDEQARAITALLAWLDTGSSEAEIDYQPDRVLMHDTTSTPALVDIAGMRDALAEAGQDPALLNPVLPVEVSVDHSLAVEVFGRPDAVPVNLDYEMRRNHERYCFLRWATKALRGVRVNPPGTGIMHTINLEQLATVVTRQERQGVQWVVPDMMLGTDSHTPMINGIGVLGWGVGGLEAQTVMFGMPTVLRIPDVIGVRLTGALPPGVTATDLALTVTKRLRDLGVSGEFVEFFGEGVATLSAAQRCVIANMAPEYGATTGFFPIDGATLAYLRSTGRDDAHIGLVEQYARRAGLWFDPQAQPRFTQSITIDLSAVGLQVAGPRRPQDLLPLAGMQAVLAAEAFVPAADSSLPRHPVAIAAITSCTNTSDPALLIAAGLLARNAHARGLRVPEWVKTSLSPGSPAAGLYLARAGVRDALAAVGFDVVGYGCATCIGNSGSLPPVIRQAMSERLVRPVAVLSGNRNFTGRVHPDLDLGFLMSPPMVVAFALAGDAARNLSCEPVGTDKQGVPVYLHELWPKQEEVQALAGSSTRPAEFRQAFQTASENPAWHQLPAPDTARFPWNPDSNTLRRPPFASADEGSQLGHYTAWPLMVLGDDVTTDHISPASAIPPDSLIADYLVARGENRNDLNVFASRRGNWEVMMRGTFYSKSLRNLIQPDLPVGQTLYVPDGEILPIWEAAERYRQAGQSVVIVAGARYGTGSSRDWAAKGQRLLGVRAVLANSFERIHRSNLIGMGILPLQLPSAYHPEILALQPGDRIEVAAEAAVLGVRAAVPVKILRADGHVEIINTTAAVETLLDLALLRHGGVMPYILQQHLNKV